jgi:hypothetical protein
MAPADERLQGHHLAGTGLDDRLVVKLELLAGERRPQFQLQAATGPDLLVHLGLEEAEHASTVRFGTIKGQIRILQQLIRIGAVSRPKRNPDAGSDMDLMVLDVERPRELLDQPSGGARRCRRLLPGELEDRELVAAEACNDIAVSEALADSLRHADK